MSSVVAPAFGKGTSEQNATQTNQASSTGTLAPATILMALEDDGSIDWTNPDFRASAMTADGRAYGIVEPRRGRFREEPGLY